MDPIKRLVHDLRNAVLLFESSATRVAKLACNDCVTQADLCLQAQRLSAGVIHLKQLVGQLSDHTTDQPSEGVDLMQFSNLHDQLCAEVLPTLAQVHNVEVATQGTTSSDCYVVASLPHVRAIADNLVANAAHAGATRVAVVTVERPHAVDLIFRDNGRGMSEEQLRQLGFGFTTKGDWGHGQGFRIVRKLAVEFGAAVTPARSIPGIGTEIVVTLLKRVDPRLRPQ
jgi:signal transduction histidine kinase